jgi:hypothetical protein
MYRPIRIAASIVCVFTEPVVINTWSARKKKPYQYKVAAGTKSMESNLLNLSLSAINVNTLNISTYKDGPCKTMEKLMAIMKRGSDVIIMTDCRLGKGIEKIRKIMLLGKNNSYNLYANSTRGERGVCIAISRNRNVEIMEEVRDTKY